MVRKTDKRTSNLIIAGGYCLVAVIILLNYLGDSSRIKSRFVSSKKESSSSKPDSGIVALQKQLDEEKKVNAEMRNLLHQIQQNEISKRSQGKRAFKQLDAENSLPKLNEELLKANLQPRPNPFIPGKNPFASANKTPEKNYMFTNEVFWKLIPDSSLPYIFSGDDSEAEITGN